MKILFVTGNHLRHFYLVRKFTNFFKNFILISEKRNITPNHSKLLKNVIYKTHIEDFFNKEKKILKFNIDSFKKKNQKKIYYFDRDKNNNIQFNSFLWKTIKKENPKFLIAYGCQKIDNKVLDYLKSFNVHGGLLPNYRGVNTNFWPHYNDESHKIGMTLHSMTPKIDIGEIFFQTGVHIKKKYNINEMSCHAVKNFCKDVPLKFFQLSKRKIIKGKKIKHKKKIWKKKDFKISKIKIAYKNFENFKKKYFKTKKKFKSFQLINIY